MIGLQEAFIISIPTVMLLLVSAGYLYAAQYPEKASELQEKYE